MRLIGSEGLDLIFWNYYIKNYEWWNKKFKSLIKLRYFLVVQQNLRSVGTIAKRRKDKKKLIVLNIRTYNHADMEEVIHVWEEYDLIRGGNNPKLDTQRNANTQKDLFFVGVFSNKVIATAMFGYDGHIG